MKIKPEHYAVLRDAISVLAPKLQAHRELLEQDPRVKDVEKRLRWDALYAAKLTPWICANLYPYVNDEYIDTALRRILGRIEMERAA